MIDWSIVSTVSGIVAALGAVAGWVTKVVLDKLNHIHECVHEVERKIDDHIQYHLRQRP